MKKLLFFFILIFFIVEKNSAQYSRYIIRLKNKGNSSFSFSSPLTYLSQRAIDRRTRYNIALDSADLPCTPSYVNQIKAVPNVTLLNVSKWMNAVTIQTTDANALTTINGFPFVQSTNAIASRYANPNPDSIQNRKIETNFSLLPNSVLRGEGMEGDFFNYGSSAYNEIHLHNGEFLHDIGLRGQGMRIALLDNGFNNYLSPSLHSFDSCNANGQVLDGWNFVFHNSTVNNDGSHGMSVFSCIVSNIPGSFVGTSPNANFCLYQTEDNTSEYPIEEFNWSCGAERADSMGADVISTSLGYNTFDSSAFNHTYADMNGRTTMSAMAANMAARKGMLVFAAVGNSGTSTWHYLITPSDADSILAVGAVNSSGVVGSFSSYGPSSDGRVKPDVAGVGVNAVVETFGGVGLSNGTSFATPKMAGLGTSLWQGFPEFSNIKILRALQKAGNIFSAPDNRTGYGIPNMKTAFSNLLIDFATSSSSVSGCTVTIHWTSKDVSAMNYEIEKKSPSDVSYSKIATVNPQAGLILANHSYQYNDTLPANSSGIFSYRIRQIIDTASATFTAVYIDTTSVNPSSTCVTPITADKIYFSPNPPAANPATLVVETNYAIANMPVKIFDMTGRLMMQQQLSKGAGKASFDIPVQRFANGIYVVKVYNADKLIATVKLILQL